MKAVLQCIICAALVAFAECHSHHGSHITEAQTHPTGLNFEKPLWDVSIAAGIGPTGSGESIDDKFWNHQPCVKKPKNHVDGPAESARFGAPTRAQWLKGVWYLLDPQNGCIRSLQNGTVSSVTPCCTSDVATGTRGEGPQDMFVTDEYLYLLDSYNNQLKRSPRPFTKWTVLAGNGSRPHHGKSEDGLALEVAMNEPHGMAVTTDGSGDIYLSETWSSCVRLLRNGTLTTVAGRCGFGGIANGAPDKARFQHPHHISLDPRDESAMYLADAECWDDNGPPDDTTYYPCMKTNDGGCFSGIRKITLDRGTGLAVNVSLLAGQATKGKHGKISKSCSKGSTDGKGFQAMFNFIHGTAFPPLSDAEEVSKRAGAPLSGSRAIYICEEDGNHIRKIDLHTTMVTTIAGSGHSGIKNGKSSTASFSWPGGLGLDLNGNIMVGDYESHRFRLVKPPSPLLV